MWHIKALFVAICLLIDHPGHANECADSLTRLLTPVPRIGIVQFPAATGCDLDGKFLVQKKYGYDDQKNKDFMAGMVAAIKEVMAVLGKKTRPLRAADIAGLLDIIAKKRHDIAAEAGDPDKDKYGRKIDRSKGNTWMFDIIDASNRHAHVYKDAKAMAAEHSQKGFSLRGKRPVITFTDPDDPKKKVTIQLSIFEEGAEGSFNCQHPFNDVNGTDAIELAFRMLAKIVNERARFAKPENAAELHGWLTQAYFILMHHTPYVRGTPSIVESLIEAILRQEFKTAHAPAKYSEGFWDAMLGRPIVTRPSFVVRWMDAFWSLFGSKKVFEYRAAWKS